MAYDVLLLMMIIWLPGTLTRVVRQVEEIQTDEPPCTMYTLSGLLHVSCADRGLTEILEWKEEWYEANVLDLSNNNFATFPKQLENFHNLQVLDFSGNHLNEPLPPYVENLRHLRTLNLSKNNYEVWIGSARSQTIKTLDLSENKINTIDAVAITAMPSLSHFDLSENRIYDMAAKMFESAHNLEVLILSRNYFSDVPNFQSGSLRSLHLSNCQITNLDADSLQGLNSLLILDLSINQIERVPEHFASNTLQELDLSYNEIEALTDRSFSSLPHLAVLNLRGNDFREVWPTSYFASNPFLREVHVKGNRWSCEGFSVNLLLTYDFLAPKVQDERALICYSPANVTQMSWQQAYIQTWHSDAAPESNMVMAVMIGVIIGIVLTSLVCRGLMALNQSEQTRPSTATTNLNGMTPQARAESVEIRVPLREEDQPPTYDEALLMPRLNTSFHSLPDFVDGEPTDPSRQFRRSRSIGDLTEHRPRVGDRRSVRRTVEIHITQTDNVV